MVGKVYLPRRSCSMCFCSAPSYVVRIHFVANVEVSSVTFWQTKLHNWIQVWKKTGKGEGPLHDKSTVTDWVTVQPSQLTLRAELWLIHPQKEVKIGPLLERDGRNSNRSWQSSGLSILFGDVNNNFASFRYSFRVPNGSYPSHPAPFVFPPFFVTFREVQKGVRPPWLAGTPTNGPRPESGHPSMHPLPLGCIGGYKTPHPESDFGHWWLKDPENWWFSWWATKKELNCAKKRLKDDM